MVQAEAAAVEPDEERSLRTHRHDAGNVLAQVITDKIHIAFHILQHLAPPSSALREGGFRGDRRKEERPVEFVRLQKMVEPLADARVGHHAERTHQTGDVEGLAGRRESDGHLRRHGRDRLERMMFRVTERHVGVDLVGNHQHVVFPANVRHRRQVLGGPDDAGGIVRIGENQHLRRLPAAHFLQARDVHPVAACGCIGDERIVHHLTPVVARQVEERHIDRRLDDHFVARLREALQHEADAPHDARDETQFLPADAPAVQVPLPVDDRGPIRIGRHAVTIDLMSEPLFKGFPDRGRRLEIHVGHPESQQVVTPVTGLEKVRHDGAGTAPFYHLVEVKSHGAEGTFNL